ncbi:MAG: hypothetical protein HY952_11010 [Elusimicrobia bacterium]|nr:hypothetical protein [Elusimicrobiota bacterium]
MTLILKIFAVGLLHVAFFASYPETGPYGNFFMGGSILVWSVFMIFINTSTKLVRFISGAAGLVLNLAAFALIAAGIAFTMPQRDKVSVLEKIQKGKYPDRDTLNSGMLRFGVRLDTSVKTGIKGLDAEVGKAIKKLKEDQ